MSEGSALIGLIVTALTAIAGLVTAIATRGRGVNQSYGELVDRLEARAKQLDSELTETENQMKAAHAEIKKAWDEARAARSEVEALRLLLSEQENELATNRATIRRQTRMLRVYEQRLRIAGIDTAISDDPNDVGGTPI